MKVVYGILIALAVFLFLFAFYLNINAARAKAKARRTESPRKNVSEEKLKTYIENLSALIRCKTVADGQNEKEFEKFRATIKKTFPLLHERAELKVFGGGCLIFKITGKNPVKNIMLMSHHDVVEAEGEWKQPPFEGIVADGALWGRGTVDTKTPLFAELTAVEELLEQNYSFNGINLYIGSSNNEEICGDGIPLAVQYFKENNIRFDSVLDEGGAIISGMMPGVTKKSAMVAVHEKGRHIYDCTLLNSDKGHLGLNPVKTNVIDAMSEFIVDVKKAKIPKSEFYPEVKEMFVRHAPYMSYPYRLLFANFGIFKGLLLRVLPLVSAQVSGMLQTNMYFTSIQAGEAPQIQAKKINATAFFRCVREETLEKELLKFKEIAARHKVEVKENLRDYCRPFSGEQEQFKVLENTLHTVFPDVIVSPFLLTAGTDARHFTDIADCILRFAPIDLNKEQFASVHNPNENINVNNIGECVCFYKEYVKNVCGGHDV